MPGLGHHWTPTSSKDCFLDVHRALDIVNEQVFSFLCANNIVGQQGNQSVRIDERARLIDGTQSVAITIGTKSEFAAMFNHGLAQVNHVLRPSRICTVVWFSCVPIAEQINVINTHLVEQLGHCRSWYSVATVDGNLDRSCNRSCRFENRIKVGVQVRCVANRSFTDSELSSQEDLLQLLNLFTCKWQGTTAHLEPVMGWHW